MCSVMYSDMSMCSVMYSDNIVYQVANCKLPLTVRFAIVNA